MEEKLENNPTTQRLVHGGKNTMLMLYIYAINQDLLVP